MGKNKNITRPVVIVLEGLDYLYTILKQIQGNTEFNVDLWDFTESLSVYENFEQLLSHGKFVRQEVRALGIIRDAETSRESQEASLKALLEQFKLPIPRSQMTVAAGGVGVPKTGYLIMPHDSESGCLENALLASTRQPALLACAEAYLSCVSQGGQAKDNPNWRAKVKVHAMIAANLKDPAASLSCSTLPGFDLWNLEHEALHVMLRFIKMMQG